MALEAAVKEIRQDELRRKLVALVEEVRIEQSVFYRMSQRTDVGNEALYSISMRLSELNTKIGEWLTALHNV